jgi:CRP/FNR family cyclic AMP-dependent transcriptional regulator
MNASTAGLLEEQGFFAGVPERVADAISSLATERNARIGELLLRQGEPADRFFLVRYGLVAIEMYAPGRDPIAVDHMYVGDVVGWSWLVPPFRCSLDARAVEPSSLIEIDAVSLRERFGTDPILGYEVLRRFIPVIAHLLSSARERLVECLTEPW